MISCAYYLEGKETTFPECGALPNRGTLVIEELDNENPLSEQRLLHLAPEFGKKYPDTRSIYNKLHE